MIYIRLIFISFLLIQSISTLAQNPLIVKRSEQQSRIEFLTDLDAAPIFDYGSEDLNIVKVEVAPAPESKVAIIEVDRTESYRNRVGNLIIFDRTGTILHQEDSVLEFSWNTPGDALVLTKGRKNPDGLDDPMSWKIIDFSQNSGREVSLEMDHYYPFQFNWIKNDQMNTIYFRSSDTQSNFGIVAYDVNQKSFTKTSYLANSFSPDGQYLAISNYESTAYGACDKEYCFKIIEVATGKVVEYFSNEALGEPHGWMGNSGHHYLFKKNYSARAKEPAENFIYNVETTAIIDHFEGEIINGFRRNNIDYFVSDEYLLLNTLEYGPKQIGVKLYRNKN